MLAKFAENGHMTWNSGYVSVVFFESESVFHMILDRGFFLLSTSIWKYHKVSFLPVTVSGKGVMGWICHQLTILICWDLEKCSEISEETSQKFLPLL